MKQKTLVTADRKVGVIFSAHGILSGLLIFWLAATAYSAVEPSTTQELAAKKTAALDVKKSVQTTDTWHGFTRHKFQVDGCNAWIVEPKTPAAGKPWTWCMEFPDAFTDRTGVLQLLAQGFHHVHIQVGNTFGCPSAVKHFDAFYQVLQGRGLATKGTLIGISRGGLYAYNWAARNPDKVVCIYGDAPVCDFKSWPAGRGKGKGSPKDWQSLIKCYEFANEADALTWKQNPVDNLAAIARAKIPLIHVVGDVDDVVPCPENTAIIEQRYRALGGTMTVLHKPNVGHHPHGLDDPAPLVDFILRSSKVKN
jgi:hypothetical protein